MLESEPRSAGGEGEKEEERMVGAGVKAGSPWHLGR